MSILIRAFPITSLHSILTSISAARPSLWCQYFHIHQLIINPAVSFVQGGSYNCFPRALPVRHPGSVHTSFRRGRQYPCKLRAPCVGVGKTWLAWRRAGEGAGLCKRPWWLVHSTDSQAYYGYLEILHLEAKFRPLCLFSEHNHYLSKKVATIKILRSE